MENGVLDQGNHIVFSFKENTTKMNEKAFKKNILVDSRKGIHIGKNHGSCGKIDSSKSGKVFNRTL